MSGGVSRGARSKSDGAEVAKAGAMEAPRHALRTRSGNHRAHPAHDGRPRPQPPPADRTHPAPKEVAKVKSRRSQHTHDPQKSKIDTVRVRGPLARALQTSPRHSKWAGRPPRSVPRNFRLCYSAAEIYGGSYVSN